MDLSTKKRVFFIFTCLVLSQTSLAAPTLTYQGRLSGQNGEVNASLEMVFSIYTEQSGGESIWVETHPSVAVTDGHFTAVLGEQTPLSAMAAHPALFLGVTIDSGSEMSPRMKLGRALQAQWAAHAADVDGEAIHPRSVSIGDTLVIDENGNWVGSLAGLRGPEGPPGPNGAPGADGVSVVSGLVDETGDLILTLSEGGPINAGQVRGAAGQNGDQGINGQDGISCWDLNANGVADSPLEDLNQDGFVSVLDCMGAVGAPGSPGAQGPPGPPGTPGQNGTDGSDGLGIQSASVNEQGELILTLSNNATTNAGVVVGPAGQNGSDGVGIQGTTINAQGELLVTLTDGQVLNAGVVSGSGLTNSVPVHNDAPKACISGVEGEVYFDQKTKAMRICDGQFWRSTYGYCGNGKVDLGEECDGANVADAICLDSCVLASNTCNQNCDEIGNYASYQHLTNGTSSGTAGEVVLFENFLIRATTDNVYVFEHLKGQWRQTQTFQPDGFEAGARFISHAAIHGHQFVVSAVNDNDGGTNAGAVYVFEYEGGQWTQTAKLRPTQSAAGLRFGTSMDIHNGVIVVGSSFLSSGGPDYGSLFVFRKVNGVWTQTQTMRPSATNIYHTRRGLFALSDAGLVAKSNEGTSNRLVFFDDVDGQFVEAKYFVQSSDGDLVTADGNVAVQTNGGFVRIFQKTGGVWSQTQFFTQANFPNANSFGWSLDVSGDLLLVADPDDDELPDAPGAVYVFKRNAGGTYELLRKIHEPSAQNEGKFAMIVKVDGMRAIVHQSALNVPRSVHIYSNIETPQNAALCTLTGHCICRAGFGGEICDLAPTN